MFWETIVSPHRFGWLSFMNFLHNIMRRFRTLGFCHLISTHVNHWSLFTSLIDRIALSLLLLNATVLCYTVSDVACTDHCVRRVTLDVEIMQTRLQIHSPGVNVIECNFENNS